MKIKVSFLLFCSVLVLSCSTNKQRTSAEFINVWANDISGGPQFGGKKHEQASPLLVGDDIFQGSSDRKLVVINKNTGLIKRLIQEPGSIDSSPIFQDGVLYFGNRDGHIKAFSYRTGEYLWDNYVNFPLIATQAI